MSKYSRSTLTGDLAGVNAELEKVKVAIDSQYDRNAEVGTANQLETTLDANSNRIINLPAPQSPNDPARLSDVQASSNANPLPDGAGQSGNFLKTDGSTASWATVTKAVVGLGSVDNTSDLNKPVSNLQQTEINTKENIKFTTTQLISSSVVYPSGTLVITNGYTTAGDGGSGKWLKTAGTGSVSQSSIQLNAALLNDALGVQWKLVFTDEIDVLELGFNEISVTNKTLYINAAINSLYLAGGGIVKVPANKDIAVATTINLTDKAGVSILAAGGGFYGDALADTLPATRFKWTGASGGTMLRLASIQTGTKVTGCNLKGFYLDGMASAAKAIHGTSFSGCDWDDITIEATTEDGILLDCLDNKMNSGTADPADNQGNTFDKINVKTDSGNCIRLEGNDGSGSTLSANTSLNHFGQIHLNIRNNNGFVFGYSDANTVDMLRVFRPASNTGIGLVFNADDEDKEKHARHNALYHVQTGASGVLAKAGDGTQPSSENVITMFSYGNAGINNPPVIESGASLSYISPTVLKNLGGQMICAKALNDTALAAKLIALFAAQGTESLQVHNSAGNHINITTDTQKWIMRIEPSTGDLELSPSTGAGKIGLLKPLKLTNQQTGTSSTAGAATALPSQPLGYWKQSLNGVTVKIPYYND